MISLRSCQRRVKTLRNDMVRALEPRKFIEDGKWWDQGRVRGAKIACFKKLRMKNFDELHSLNAFVGNCSALPGASC